MLNALAGVSAGTDVLNSIGNLVLGGLNYANQVKVQKQQLQLLHQQLDLSQQQLNLNKLTQDPAAFVLHATSYGFDPVSARQLAGSRESRTLGAVSLPALDFQSISSLQHGSRALTNIAVNHAYKVSQSSEPVLTGYRQLASAPPSRSPSVASTMNYDSFPWHNRPITPASTVSYSSLPGTNRPTLPW